ncbi:DMT family transporter [Lactobacillus gigeriorum]|uniref:Permease n=1 Tax=Lactobacillus gigeriorum DSM 23908 = CRBIP 24.85 TaxID=1423751 RepID=I7K1C0_9LACO|nr:DMT family transporter [Lactobacillus gigeriorum]KRN14911.1 permease [Lactobacillus gigeriorum DSM 23908 = CRBIP 24.85]CCI87375.1 Putative permease [Lactobacillus gigeriorum DSM 23908 = CRBIP 24.85]
MTKKQRGVLLAVTGASLWGTSGTAAEFLFKTTGVDTFWLIGVRAWIAGIILTIFIYWRDGKKAFAIFKNKHDLLKGIIYATVGIMGSQFTYFMTVKHSNAPTGTILVFLAPVLIIAFVALKTRQIPRRIDLISVIVALFGTIIMVTGGNFTHLAITPKALFWGFLAATTQAISVVMPGDLFKKYGTLTIVSLSSIWGGIIFSPSFFMMPAIKATPLNWLTIVYIAVVGTVFAYTLYLSSVLYISAGLASILEAFEPLMATILSVGLLGSDFGQMKILGGILIIMATSLQVIPFQRSRKLLQRANKA